MLEEGGEITEVNCDCDMTKNNHTIAGLVDICSTEQYATLSLNIHDSKREIFTWLTLTHNKNEYTNFPYTELLGDQ